jgi:predicted ester cyclase
MPDNKTVIRRLCEEILTRKDLTSFWDVVSPDVVDHQQIILAQPEGSKGVEEGVRALHVAFPDLRVDVDELLEEGVKVAAYLKISGTNTGDYRGLPQPTGRRALWDAVAIFTLEDGRITEIRGQADRMGMLTQLGVLPDMG